MAFSIQIGRTPYPSTARVDSSKRAIEVKFPRPFDRNPAVFAATQTFNGPDTPGLRIRDITTDGFKVELKELIVTSNHETSQLSDGKHLEETIGWIAVVSDDVMVPFNLSGLQQLGVEVRAGITKLSSRSSSTTKGAVTTNFEQIRFDPPFSAESTVVVLPMVQTFNEPDTPGLRIADVTEDGFEMRINELVAWREGRDVALSDGLHVEENVGWVAFASTTAPPTETRIEDIHEALEKLQGMKYPIPVQIPTQSGTDIPCTDVDNAYAHIQGVCHRYGYLEAGPPQVLGAEQYLFTHSTTNDEKCQGKIGFLAVFEPPDEKVRVVELEGPTEGIRYYNHPGSSQAYGNILAVPLADWNQDDTSRHNGIGLYNITNPLEPKLNDFIDSTTNMSTQSRPNAVGITNIANPGEPTRFLIAFADKKDSGDQMIQVYVQQAGGAYTYMGAAKVNPSPANWNDLWYQNGLQLFTDRDGQPWMLGMRSNKIDLWQVILEEEENRVTLMSKKSYALNPPPGVTLFDPGGGARVVSPTSLEVVTAKDKFNDDTPIYCFTDAVHVCAGQTTISSDQPSAMTMGSSQGFERISFGKELPEGWDIVVLPMIQTLNGRDSPGVRLKDVGKSGFSIRLNELVVTQSAGPKALSDGNHEAEELAWLAFAIPK